MSDHPTILSEVGGGPSTLQRQIGDTIVAVGEDGTDAAFGNAESIHLEGADTVQGHLKSPAGEKEASLGGGGYGAKDTASRADLGGAGGQHSNDQEMSSEGFPTQKTQRQYPSNSPKASNVHEISGEIVMNSDTDGKAEGRGRNATTATATTSVQPGSDTQTSRRSVRRLSSRAMTGDGDAAGGPTQETDPLAASNIGSSTAQVDGANSSKRSSKRIRRSFGASSLSFEDKASGFQGGGEAHRHLTSSAGTADQSLEEAGAYVMDSDVLALAALDEDSHQKARLRDANTYMDEVLFPITFPWYNSREPLVKTIPRDIDELYAVVYADNDYASIYQDGREGPVPDMFGYGKCEIGQERQQGAIPSFAMGGYVAVVSAARRGDDPGQIELTATMPPPPSLEAAIVYHEQRTNANAPKGATIRSTNLEEADQDTIERLKATIEAERAGACSRMPLYCEPIDGSNYFNPPTFLSDNDDEPISTNERRSADQEYSGIYKRDRRLGKRRELAKACARKWKISIKAGGSSTRTRIFRAEDKFRNEGDPARRPMLRTAILPPSVLSGQNVPVAVAAEFDQRESLGSYDVRANASAAEKTASSNVAKRKIAIGRTRLVWTKKNERAEGASKYGKSTYTSIITGQKLETNAQKRPREVRIGVRLHGQLLMEPIAASDSPLAKSPNSAAKKGRKVKDNDVVADSLSVSPMVPANDNRKASDIKRAVDAVCSESLPQKKKAAESSTSGVASRSILVIDPTAVFANVASRIKQAHNLGGGKRFDSYTNEPPKNKEDTKRPATGNGAQDESMHYVAMKHGATLAMKHVAPRYGLLPLDDGLLRTICIAPGSMHGVSVNNMLNAASKERKGNRICSVCWTGDAVGPLGNDLRVQECIDCGLGVHLDCCENRGDLVKVPAGTSSSGGGPNARPIGHMDFRWRCAICVDYHNLSNSTPDDPSEESSIAAKKPRRAAKLPSRFTEGETHLAGHSSGRSSRNRPSPSCSLCPHSGGAMSMLDLGLSGGSRAEGNARVQTLWTHEVCRVWCQPTTNTSLVAAPSNTPVDHQRCNSLAVCVLCGTGSCSGADAGIDNLPPGLVKCAAKGCCTTFHPMCALLATKMLPRLAATHRSCDGDVPKSPKGASRKSHKKKPSDTAGATGKEMGDEDFELEERRAQDIHLCKQYTLTLAEVRHDSGPGSAAATTVPVAFCGLHNPQREVELVGCLPGGGVITEEVSGTKKKS